MKIKTERFACMPSTNDYAKSKRGEREDLLEIARAQTGGRGTKGRSFSSEEGGLYLTKLTFYENFPAKEAFKIMQSAAAAVCETLAFFGVSPKIKWPNDVFVRGRKICGILIENTFSGARIDNSVVGIGLNVCNKLPAELCKIATTLQRETGTCVSVEEVEKRLIDRLSEEEIYKKYADYLGWLGENVTLISGEKQIPATLLSVDGNGGLWAQTSSGKMRFTAAEVSLRIEEED